MTKNTNFIESAKRSLEGLALKPVKIEESLKRIEVSGGTIDLEVFNSDKIEKAVFSSIKVSEMSVAEESVIIWPSDSYDLPIFWANLTAMPGMNISILDFIPTMDIVVWPEYAERYLHMLPGIKEGASEILKDAIVEKDFPLSSVVGWCMSPYKALFKLKEEGVAVIPSVVKNYCDAYVKLVDGAKQIDASEKQARSKQRKEAIRKLMKENDPGYPVMIGIFGEEKTAKVFDTVF